MARAYAQMCSFAIATRYYVLAHEKKEEEDAPVGLCHGGGLMM